MRGGWRLCRSAPTSQHHMSLNTLTNLLLLYVERRVTGWCNGFRSIYTRHRFMRRFLLPQNEVANRLFDSTEDIRVLAGPFQGMRYFNGVTSVDPTDRRTATQDCD